MILYSKQKICKKSQTNILEIVIEGNQDVSHRNNLTCLEKAIKHITLAYITMN